MISIDRPQFAYLFRVRADVAQKLNSSTSPYFLCKSQGHEGGSRFTTHLHMKGACKDFIGPRLIVFTEIQLIDLNGPSFQLPSFAYHQCRCVINFNGLQLRDATKIQLKNICMSDPAADHFLTTIRNVAAIRLLFEGKFA